MSMPGIDVSWLCLCPLVPMGNVSSLPLPLKQGSPQSSIFLLHVRKAVVAVSLKHDGSEDGPERK